jgi:hypothetical protein
MPDGRVSIAQERTSDSHPLLLASGQGRRVALEHSRLEALVSAHEGHYLPRVPWPIVREGPSPAWASQSTASR